MSNINVNWTPAAGIINQRVSARKKGDVLWSTANFFPANDLSAAAITAQYQLAAPNTIYQFKINSICTGNVLSPNSIIAEGLNFDCSTFYIDNITDSSLTVHLPDLSADVYGVNIQLRNPITEAILANYYPTIVANAVTFNITSLLPGIGYKIVINLYSDITNNGITKTVSNDGENCFMLATTTNSNPNNCKTYVITFGQGQGGTIDVIECDGAHTGAGSPQQGQVVLRCIQAYSVLGGTYTVEEYDSCNCFDFYNNSGVTAVNVGSAPCGDPSTSITQYQDVAPGQSVCAQSISDPSGHLASIGPCA